MDTALVTNPSRPPVALTAGNDHPVVDMPFTAVIDGRHFRGRGISLVAAYVLGLVDPAMLNATRLVRLVFQFDGFSVALDVDATLRPSASSSGEVELIFTRPTGPHLPQLRHILNAFIAGDLVGLGQTIGVAGTAAPKRPSAAAPRPRVTFRRMIGGAAIGLLSILLVAIAWTLVYQKLYVSVVPTPGAVVSTGEVMRATATGQIVFLDLQAAEGEVALAIQSASGDVQSLLMPCDCTVTSKGLREGSTVLIGEPVLQLSSAGDRYLVAATIPSDMAFDLAGADQIELAFPDGSRSTATADLGRPATGMSVGDGQTVFLEPETPLSADRLGQPVKIRIQRGGGSPSMWVAALRDSLAAFFQRN
ncbi:hypothetical protein [Tabrizicola sp. BL-A-41-H6]|uniref:hypothetical protein n=1 Tax=Tabrizicola sp. BL-A-41-H6 TaxID=3421107 RepID=UPI003D66A50E